MAKKYLDVAYKDRDLAKRLGARWDPNVKRWYCPAGSDLARIFAWRQTATVKTDPHVHLAAVRRPRGVPAKPQPQNFELSLFA